ECLAGGATRIECNAAAAEYGPHVRETRRLEAGLERGHLRVLRRYAAQECDVASQRASASGSSPVARAAGSLYAGDGSDMSQRARCSSGLGTRTLTRMPVQ